MIMSISGFVDTIPVSTLQSVSIIESEFVQAALTGRIRISVSKRRHGLQRCRYRGDDGMQRWVGLGIIADNLINIGRFVATQPAT